MSRIEIHRSMEGFEARPSPRSGEPGSSGSRSRGRGWALALLGGLARFLYGSAATVQTDPHLARIVAAFGASIEDLDRFRRERPGRYEVKWSGDPNGGT